MDFTQARTNFTNYVATFGDSNHRYKLKYDHSLRTETAARQICASENDDPQTCDLAEMIGLLHDIGRFEQLRRFDSFSDAKTIDHAALGNEILQKDDFIKSFCADEKLYPIIYTAIFNHNKYQIEPGLDDATLFHAKVIRDADKYDILNFMGFESFDDLSRRDSIADDEISDEFVAGFEKGKMLLRDDCKTSLESYLFALGYVFDINFKQTFVMLKASGYLEKLVALVDSPKNHEKMEKMLADALAYVDRQISPNSQQ